MTREEELEKIIQEQCIEIEQLRTLVENMRTMVRGNVDGGCPYYARIKDIDPNDKRLREKMHVVNFRNIVQGPAPCPYNLNLLMALTPKPQTKVDSSYITLEQEDGSHETISIYELPIDLLRELEFPEETINEAIRFKSKKETS